MENPRDHNFICGHTINDLIVPHNHKAVGRLLVSEKRFNGAHLWKITQCFGRFKYFSEDDFGVAQALLFPNILYGPFQLAESFFGPNYFNHFDASSRTWF